MLDETDAADAPDMPQSCGTQIAAVQLCVGAGSYHAVKNAVLYESTCRDNNFWHSATTRFIDAFAQIVQPEARVRRPWTSTSKQAKASDLAPLANSLANCGSPHRTQGCNYDFLGEQTRAAHVQQ